jgi:hypothetical protein
MRDATDWHALATEMDRPVSSTSDAVPGLPLDRPHRRCSRPRCLETLRQHIQDHDAAGYRTHRRVQSLSSFTMSLKPARRLRASTCRWSRPSGEDVLVAESPEGGPCEWRGALSIRHGRRCGAPPRSCRRSRSGPASPLNVRIWPGTGLNLGHRGGRDRRRGRASTAPPCARRRPRTRAPRPGRGRQGRPPPS